MEIKNTTSRSYLFETGGNYSVWPVLGSILYMYLLSYIYICPQAVGKEILQLADAGIWISGQNPEKDIQVCTVYG